MKHIKSSQIFSCFFVGIGLLVILTMYGMDIARMIHWRIPNEIREGANVALVDFLARGINPYRSLTNEAGQPNVYYMYPILNNLIAALIVRVTHMQSGLILLLLNLLWTIAVSFLITRICATFVRNRYLLVLPFLLGHYCAWRYTNCSAFPDTLALFLMTLIMYLCSTRKITGKYAAILSFITTLCFYSKQYAVVVIIPVAVYLWLKEGRKISLSYVGITALLGGVSALLIYLTMPLYFVETLLLVGNSADNHLHWAITQFVKMGKLFFGWYLLILVWLIQGIKNKKLEADYVMISFWSMAVLLLYFGQNQGAHMSYHLQLWLPAVIVIAVKSLDVIVKRYQDRWQRYLLLCAALMCAVYPYYFLHTPQLSAGQKENWGRVYEIAEDGKVLATSQQANFAVVKGEYMYDYGQNQYILRNEALDYWEQLEQSRLMMTLFPQAMELKAAHEEYRKHILNQMENGEFDILMLVENMGFTRDWPEFMDVRDKRYELIEEIELETGVWKWNVGTWKRLSDHY